MSTKSTLLSFDSVHLYTEAFDDKNVYLEMDNIKFNASNNQITLEIPIEIWEVIRQKEAIYHYCHDWTDDYIKDYVENEVSKRINEKGILRIFGMFIYGDADDCKEEQIKIGIDYYTKKRTEENALINKIAALKIEANPIPLGDHD